MAFASKLRDHIASLYRHPFFQVATITILAIFVSALAVNYFEDVRDDANIHSVWDAVWWAVVTMGTVGYGDKYPISVGGRIVGLIVIFSGVGLMSLFTATIASIFVEKKIREEKGLETVKEKDHIVICGWNQYTEEVLLGLNTYESTNSVGVVLINELPIDDVDTLRLKYRKNNLSFLRGDYVHEDVLLRANIKRAKFALIMADLSGGHGVDRVDERTTLAALTIKSIAPQIRTIAEILDNGNRSHLKRANVDEIIVRGENVGTLLASAINSPGLPKMIANILSLAGSNKLCRIEIPHTFIGKTFRELSLYYREKQHAILIGLLKEKKSMKLDDLLSDNTSVIDNFIKEKIRESKKDFFYERDDAQIIINPDDGCMISSDDYAVVLARSNSK
jgi:voltage-gated potassium channel